MLKASNAKPEAWESWTVKIERRRRGTLCNLHPLYKVMRPVSLSLAMQASAQRGGAPNNYSTTRFFKKFI
jgi:hypothetical protein